MLKIIEFSDWSYYPGFMILHGFEEVMTFQMGSLLGLWKTDLSISGMLRNSWMDKSKVLKPIPKDATDSRATETRLCQELPSIAQLSRHSNSTLSARNYWRLQAIRAKYRTRINFPYFGANMRPALHF